MLEISRQRLRSIHGFCQCEGVVVACVREQWRAMRAGLALGSGAGRECGSPPAAAHCDSPPPSFGVLQATRHPERLGGQAPRRCGDSALAHVGRPCVFAWCCRCLCSCVRGLPEPWSSRLVAAASAFCSLRCDVSFLRGARLVAAAARAAGRGRVGEDVSGRKSVLGLQHVLPEYRRSIWSEGCARTHTNTQPHERTRRTPRGARRRRSAGGSLALEVHHLTWLLLVVLMCCALLQDCCPVYRAQCCSDGIHCCPLGYTCSGDGTSCETSRRTHPLQATIGSRQVNKPKVVPASQRTPSMPAPRVATS